MYRGSVAFLLLTALPLLAEEAAIDPYEDLPDYYPQHYRSLADVPERYHDGEKLTGCFMLDSVRQDYVGHGPWPDEKDIVCHNPFYWDEHGRIKNFRYGGDPSAKPPPPSGLPLGSELREDSLPAPCEGCLSEEQALDVVRVYHRELGIEPLGYKASIVRGYPWNGRGSGLCEKYDRTSYLDSLYPDPRDPHPNERVNMRRVRRPMMGFNELCDASKDPQNRELTWRVRFQIGWHEPENRILNDHNLHKRDWPRTPCTVTNYIHAQTGNIRNKYQYRLQRYNHNPGERCRGATIENLHLLASTGRRAWNAFHQMHQRLFSYLPDSPSRDDRWLDYSEAKRLIKLGERELEWEEAKRKREAEEREGEVRGDQETHHLPPIDLRDTGDPSVLRDSTGDSGAQHIIVYWGETPTTNLGHDDCFQEDDPDTDEDESELHDTKCKARVPRIRQCNDRNIPYSEPPAEDTTTYDCMLWTRLQGNEQCHYRNRRGSPDTGWCVRGDGRRYRGSGFASAEIHKHITAVKALTEHQVGMRYNDNDFKDQRTNLARIFPKLSFSDNDTFAEINMFSLKAWKVRPRSSLAFYNHRYGRGEHDDPFTNSKKNDQYRRLSAPFDWRTRGEWCHEKPRPGRSCPIWDRRYRYVLVHEGAHDVSASHLYDKFLWRTHPLMEHLQWQTRGVGEGHALFIEEIAGRRRNRNDLGLDFTGSGSGGYLLPTPNVDNRKAPGALANSDNYRATAEALLTAFRGVEDALETAVGNGLVSLDNGVRYATRRLFNNSLHSFTYLQDIFGRPNAHIDFCEARNEVHRRVRLLRTGVNHLTPFSISQPNISAAFDAMDIPACMQMWEASSTKECSEKTSGDPQCRLVHCAITPGDLIPVMIPPEKLPPEDAGAACSMKVGDVEFSRRNGVLQICIPVRWEIGSTVIEVKFCYEIPLPI